MLHGNSKVLVDHVESQVLFDGRYSKVKLVNCPVGGQKRGFFSLVFRAHDDILEKWVALKFFDLDPAKSDQYRVASFHREHEILEYLKGAPRCLQVISGFNIYDLNVPLQGGHVITLAAKYFAVEWIPGDVDSFFLEQEKHDAIAKLHVFNEVVLAVESLHSRGIFHRDLKFDNLRSRESREVVVIDLGTAARYESGPIIQQYNGPVGMLMYSAPEAFCGLSGCRSIAPCGDVFALGCMLFELFHVDDYPTAFRSVNHDYDLRFAALQAKVSQCNTEAEKILCWSREAPILLSGLGRVDLNDLGSSVPSCIADIVSDMVHRMTAVDYRFRSSELSKVRERCWQAIRVMENESLAKKRATLAAKRRAAKAERARAKAALAGLAITRIGV